jgi:hypothetical protein
MPLMRYFVFVGGALLALLLIANACLPALPLAQGSAATVDRSVLRIHSDQKWPERIVFDTTRATITPAPAAPLVAEASSPQKIATVQPLKGQVREAFAEMPPNPVQPKPRHRSVAKNTYVASAKNSYAASPRILVAQQPPVVFFGNNLW